MGWFRTLDTGEIVGDVPVDAINGAMEVVKMAYQDAFGRGPTRGEWEAVLRHAMGTADPEYRPLAKRVVVAVKIKTRPLTEAESP